MGTGELQAALLVVHLDGALASASRIWRCGCATTRG
jgi:hypothetical protein